jgi:uncharacterized membrane protein
MSSCLSFLILLIAIAAFVVALRGNARLRTALRRIDQLEREIDAPRQADISSSEKPPAAGVQKGAEISETEAPISPPEEPERESDLQSASGTPTNEHISADFEPTPRPLGRRPSAKTWSIRDLEKSLGARLPVWIGAVALILAGAFLVKVSFERGWLVPQLRVAFGIIFGAVLLGAGEWLRKPAYRISQGLSAAGIAVLFVSFYAGVNLYHLITPTAGFAFMALTAAVAVVLSLRQGAMVAVLGLIGGFVTPQLVQAGDPDPRTLFTYLLLLQGGLVAAARKRNWPYLAAVGYCGGLIWVGLWLMTTFDGDHSLWLGLFLLASAAIFVGASLSARGSSTWGSSANAQWLTRLAIIGGLVGLGALTVRADFQALDWLFVGLMGASCLILARLKEEFHQFGWLAGAASALLVAVWIPGIEDGSGRLLLATVSGLGFLFAAGSYIAHRRSELAERWCALSAASGVVFLLLAYWGARELGLSIQWGLIGAALGGIYVAAAVPLYRDRSRSSQIEHGLAALAVGATSALSLAVPMQLERSSLAVAWALEVAALVWLAGRLRVPVLRILAWIVGVLVTLHLVHPELVPLDVGDHLIFNWLFFMYGIPLLAFAAAAYLAAQQAEEKLSEALQWGAIIFGVVLVSLEVRQYFHPGELDASEFYLAERGTLTIVWLGLAWGLLQAAVRWPLRSFSRSGSILVALALAYSLFDQGLAANPAWSHGAVGAMPVLNSLLWVYGLPAVLLLIVAKRLGATQGRLALAANIGALVNILLLITLEVRQAFRGSYLDRGTASSAEQYSYSAAWILLGTLLLILGIAKKGRLVRFASLAVMLLAVGKVFLVDMAKLGDLYRVFSFLGLGVSLLLLAYLYQRFVFGVNGDELAPGVLADEDRTRD